MKSTKCFIPWLTAGVNTLTGFVIGNLGMVFFGAFNIRLQLRGLGGFAALKAA